MWCTTSLLTGANEGDPLRRLSSAPHWARVMMPGRVTPARALAPGVPLRFPSAGDVPVPRLSV